MKRYIFLPYAVNDVGGAELYILNKINWLKANNWETHILSASDLTDPYKIKALDFYRNENMPILNRAPFECSSKILKTTIKKMIDIIGGTTGYEETIIESQTGAGALWSELLAEQVHGKHIIALINETFNEKSYKEKIDFFLYKKQRRELFGGLHAISCLLGEKMPITPNDANPLRLQEDPVQDVEDDRLDMIKKHDYTICYIGRVSKSYVPNIINGVVSFAQKHLDKSIQFVIIGDPNSQIDLINTTVMRQKNISTVLIGDMIPIPRKLFSLIDVVAAGSGSARCAALECVPTIVADPDNNLANGVLGYDLGKSVGRETDTRQRSFEEAFEEVLIQKSYKNYTFKMPPKRTVDECCKQNFFVIEQSESSKDYYDSNLIVHGNTSISARIKTMLIFYFPKLSSKLIKIKNKRKK